MAKCKLHVLWVTLRPLKAFESCRIAQWVSPLRLDYGGLGLVWQNCNISVIYHWI